MKAIKKARRGVFCKVLDDTPRLALAEFFLSIGELDNDLVTASKMLGLSKATVYNEAKELEEQNLLQKTRVIGRTQLYKWNQDSQLGRTFKTIFKLALKAEL